MRRFILNINYNEGRRKGKATQTVALGAVLRGHQIK